MTDEILDECGEMPYCCKDPDYQTFSIKNDNDNRYDGMDGNIYEFYKCENCKKVFKTTYERTVKIVSQKEAERMLGVGKD